jgi:hypothetical protein
VTVRRPGGGAPKKWEKYESFVMETVKAAWERGTPLCVEQLMLLFQAHVRQGDDEEAKGLYVTGKPNTRNKFLHRTLKRHHYSVRENSISQSIPVDWRVKAEENSLRIRTQFKAANVDVVVNADETFVLFHMQDHKLIVPTGIKRVGTAAQVDNDKVGATVLIACEFKTSTILPPMVIFTGVYGAKLMQQWETFEEGKKLFYLFFLFISYVEY